MKSQIYVPQTGTIYPSAEAAGKALGVDPSNIGKVLRGSRLSAGGYNFVRVTPDVSPASLQFINEALETQLTPAKKKRQAQRRKETQEKKRARDKERTAAAKALHESLVEANKILAQYKKQKLDAISGVIPELENLKNVVGINKKGGFNTSLKNLGKFDKKQLEAIKKSLDAQMNRKGFKNLEDAKKKKQAIAFQMGVSSEELDKYADVLPLLWQLLEVSRKAQKDTSDPVAYKGVQDAMQANVDPEELKTTLKNIINEYETAMESGAEVDFAAISRKHFETLDLEEEEEDFFSGEWIDITTASEEDDEEEEEEDEEEKKKKRGE